MITFILLLIALFWAFGATWLNYHSKQNNDYEGSMAVGYVFAVIFLVITLVIGGVSYTTQMRRIENITAINEKKIVYEEKSQTLIDQFTLLLETKYPAFEREMFDNMSPDDVKALLIQYPELRTSETIIALVNKIAEYKSDVYAQEIKLIEVKRDIRVAKKNVWNVRFILPEYHSN